MAMAILSSHHHHHPLRHCSSPQSRFRRIDQRPRVIAYPLDTRLKLSRPPSFKLDERVSTFIERCHLSLRLSSSSRLLKHGEVGERNIRLVSCSQAKQSDHHGIDSESAEWINTAMHDPMVEVDPVTVCHQILAEKQSRPLEESTTLVDTTAPASQQRLVRFRHITIASVIALFLLAVVGILQYLRFRKTGGRQRRNEDATLSTNTSEPSRAETKSMMENIGANAEPKGMTAETIGAPDGAFKATAAVIAENAAVESPPFSKDVTDQNEENLRSDYEDMVLEQSSTVPGFFDQPEQSNLPNGFSSNNETEQNITLANANESLEQKTDHAAQMDQNEALNIKEGDWSTEGSFYSMESDRLVSQIPSSSETDLANATHAAQMDQNEALNIKEGDWSTEGSFYSMESDRLVSQIPSSIETDLANESHAAQTDQNEALNIKEGDWSTEGSFYSMESDRLVSQIPSSIETDLANTQKPNEMPDSKGLTEGQMGQDEELNLLTHEPSEMPDSKGLTEGQMDQNEESNLHLHEPSVMPDSKGLTEPEMGQNEELKLGEDQWFDLELYNQTERGRLMDARLSSSQIDPATSADTESGRLMDPWFSSSQSDPAGSAKSDDTRLGQGHNGGIRTVDSLPDVEEVLQNKPPVELAAKGSVPSFWSSDDLLTAASSPAELSTHGLSSPDLQIPPNSLIQPQLDDLRVLEAPELELPPFESSEIANDKASEQDRETYTKALEPALPAAFVAMGTVGTLLGVAGGLQVVGFAAAARLISRDLFLAESREAFWQELRSITDRQKLRDFLIKRNIVKDY